MAGTAGTLAAERDSWREAYLRFRHLQGRGLKLLDIGVTAVRVSKRQKAVRPAKRVAREQDEFLLCNWKLNLLMAGEYATHVGYEFPTQANRFRSSSVLHLIKESWKMVYGKDLDNGLSHRLA